MNIINEGASGGVRRANQRDGISPNEHSPRGTKEYNFPKSVSKDLEKGVLSIEQLNVPAYLSEMRERERNFLGAMSGIPHFLTLRENRQEQFFFDFIEGTDLREFIGQIKWIDSLLIAHQGAEILYQLSTQGWIHGDIKPENLMYEPGSRLITIVDGGTAIEEPKEKQKKLTPRSAFGTPGYQAPEVYFEREFDASIDLWSMGVTLFELFTSGTDLLCCETEEGVGEEKREEMQTMRYFSLLGLPPRGWVESSAKLQKYCSIDSDGRVSLKEQYRFHPMAWQKNIREFCAGSGRAEEEGEKLIDLLSQIFQYEKRPSPIETATHSFFKEVDNIDIDGPKNLPGKPELQFTISNRGPHSAESQQYAIPLRSRVRCIHYIRGGNEQAVEAGGETRGLPPRPCFEVKSSANGAFRISRITSAVSEQDESKSSDA